jgi:hypothetical protein
MPSQTQKHSLSTFNKSALLKALVPILPCLPGPSSLYPTLMRALLKLTVSISPEVFDIMCVALIAPDDGNMLQRKVAGTQDSSEAIQSRLHSLTCQELVTVLGVLSAQRHYLPERDFLDKLLERIQYR